MTTDRVFVVFAALLLAACAPAEGDLKAELQGLVPGLRAKTEPLPTSTPTPRIGFDAFELPDPFHPWVAIQKSDPTSRRDRMLLARYAVAAEIERTHERAVANASSAIADGEDRVKQHRKRLAELASERALLKSGDNSAGRLENDIRSAEVDLKAQESLLAARQTELASIETWYQEDRKRFAELSGKRK